jgi:TonB family protein
VPLNNHDKDVTFLTLPPDAQKLTRKPKTNVLSDKDRIATSRHPELDAKELHKILATPPPGAPGPRGPKGAQPPPPPQAMMQNPPSIQEQQQNAPAARRPQFESNQNALQAPPQPKNSFRKYAQGMSAGSTIQQAAQAAAAHHGAGGGGQEGDFGLGTGAHGRQQGMLDILSDTQGVDFGPYLQRILQDVRENWYHLIPESAEMKKGKLAIEFAITKDGHVADLRVVATSGDAALDRPAYGSITASNPFPPLPTEFTGPYLSLRFRFYYNPDKADLE